MYAITAITGRVGGAVARGLLAAGQPVRAVVRDVRKGAAWAARGCEIAAAEMSDAAALTAAFRDTEGVFVLLPPNFDPSPGFPESRAIVAALRDALRAARPARIVCLSTIGAQAARTNLLTQLSLLEQEVGALPFPVTFLRPGWFMENAAGDVESARRGVVSSFLQPLDKPVPMVATADVGRVAAALLQESWQGRRIVELEGPRRVTPNGLAATFAHILGRPVRAEAVPRDTWESRWRAQGMQNPAPRMAMIDGFNQGWIDFSAGARGTVKGEVELDAVLRMLVERAGAGTENEAADSW